MPIDNEFDALTADDAVLATCPGTDQARLTVTREVLSVWMVADVVGAEPATAGDHPLAAGRPTATTDSDDPLTRWEVEQVAEALAARQERRRGKQDDAALDLFQRFFASAEMEPATGRASRYVTIAVAPEEPELLLEWLNRQYVRLRTTVGSEAVAQVGAGQSAAMFLGMDHDVEPIVVESREQQMALAVAFIIATHVQSLTRQLFLR